MARKPTDTVQLKLRFPESLRRQLERAAKTNASSMNTEIVRRLQASFQKEDEDKRAHNIAQQAATAVMEGKWEVIGFDPAKFKKD